MGQELHPFWKGVQDELKKEGIWDTLAAGAAPLAEAISNPYVAATVAGGLGLAGMGLVGMRAKRLAAQAAPAAEAAKKGFGWKGMAAAAGAGALGGAYLTRKKREE